MMVEGGGFEPPKASPTDLQSVPFDHSGTPPNKQLVVKKEFLWSWRWDLNPQPADYKSAALPIELRQRKSKHRNRFIEKNQYFFSRFY